MRGAGREVGAPQLQETTRSPHPSIQRSDLSAPAEPLGPAPPSARPACGPRAERYPPRPARLPAERLTRLRGAGGRAGSGFPENGREEACEEEQGAAAAQPCTQLGHGPAASEPRGGHGAPLLAGGAGHAPHGAAEGARGAGAAVAARPHSLLQTRPRRDSGVSAPGCVGGAVPQAARPAREERCF